MVGIRAVVLEPVLDLVGRELLEESGCRVVVVEHLVVHLHVTGHAHHLGLHGRDLPAHLAVVGEVDLLPGTALGGDQDDTGGGLRTVDRGGCGILQHRDALHVVGIDVVDVVAGASVDDDQRVVVAHGGDTADLERSGRSRGAAVTRDEQTRHRTLQRRREGGRLARGQLVALDGGHRTREVLLLDRTVTDDDHFVHEFRILAEDDVQRRLAVEEAFVRLVSHVGEDERRTLLRTDRVTTLLIGGRAVVAALFEDGDSEQRRSILIADHSRHGQGLCRCHDRYGTQYAKDKRPSAQLHC